MFKFVQNRQKRKRDNVEDENDSSSDAASDSGSDSHSTVSRSSGSDSDDSDLEAYEGPQIDDEPTGTVLSADEILANPFVDNDENEELSQCLVCPGRSLKSLGMINVHRKSQVKQII